MAIQNLYEAVTADMVETPCFMGTAKEMAAFLGITLGSFYCGISRHHKKMGCSTEWDDKEQRMKDREGYRIYKISIKDIEGDN